MKNQKTDRNFYSLDNLLSLEEVHDTNAKQDSFSLVDEQNEHKRVLEDEAEASDEEELKKPRRHGYCKSVPDFIYMTESHDFKKRIRRKFHTFHRSTVDGAHAVIEKATIMAKYVVENSKKLFSHWELPDWLRDNRFILYFHRPQLESFKKCFRSIFSIHTETGNIWTHLIGLIVMVSALIFIFVRPHVTRDGSPHYPIAYEQVLTFAAFFLGACMCMTFSWLFHTLSCHSQKVQSYFAKLDYSGISLLIAGSMMPVLYYGFYCHKNLHLIYTVICLVLSLACICAALIKKMAEPKFRPLRASIFLLFGLSSIAPVAHLSALYPYSYFVSLISFYWLIAMGSCYIGGCLLYVFLIPERLLPGRINLIFQSHQIFHVLVVVGAILHLHAMCLMADFRVKLGNNCTTALLP